VEICPFDAIKPDYTTRTSDCTFCQTCGGVCPTHSIKFVDRWESAELKTPTIGRELLPSRRGFISGLLAGAGVAALAKVGGKPGESGGSGEASRQFAGRRVPAGLHSVRRMFSSVPERRPATDGLRKGLCRVFGPPRVEANWAGCESGCNNCGQVCPTGAIRALPMAEKRVARMGLAKVESFCLPLDGREACQLCVDECTAAGYNAIEFMRVHPTLDAEGKSDRRLWILGAGGVG
jgi:Fe-S-cluster-containing hydrogenase component 2